MFEHEHPLNLIDLWLEQLQHEEDEEEEENENELIRKQDFRCLCARCDEETNWFHRYYHTCSHCDYSIHKFSEKLEDNSHSHALYFRSHPRKGSWWCNICHSRHKHRHLGYYCSQCDFDVDVKCATKYLQKNIIYHPSHTHPLVCITKQILCSCDACGKEHKGTFYHCSKCLGPFIHSHCVFLPEKLQIQHNTNNSFSHIHPLTISYSFSLTDQESKFYPLCRVCRQAFVHNLWIYKCDKCRYYAHLNCATSRNEPFMYILASPGTGNTKKNYKDAEHPDLVHLPFPDPSYSLLKHLFFKENGSHVLKIKDVTEIHNIRQHQLILQDVGCGTDMNTSPSNSRIISYHDPMKRTELLCNACIRPITNGPIYACANEKEHCNFVLHEWCSRLPAELKDHPHNPQHTLVLHSKIPSTLFRVFRCHICQLQCNGFSYRCKECSYYNIDVNCAFIPKEITHTCHPNHLLSRVLKVDIEHSCSMCHDNFNFDCGFSCHICDFRIHATCALLIPKTTTIKLDKHPMELSYLPIENHKSEYFCEVCEEKLNPERSFYHCRECMQSMHTSCAVSVVRYDMNAIGRRYQNIHKFVNVKLGGTFMDFEIHPHLFSLVHGPETDGTCNICGEGPKNEIMLKCTNCEFAMHYWCRMWMKRNK